MANIEGAKRIRKAGKFTVIAGMFCLLFPILLFGVLRLAGQFAALTMVVHAASIFSVGFWLEAVGAILWVTGWVVEGFMTPPASE